MIPKPVVIDIESYGIDARPEYPPKPVGVSIMYPGKHPHYYAFGHMTKNNCTKAEAVTAIRAAYQHPDGIVCQNAKFDIDVIETHLKIRPPSWNRIHDTMFLLFLQDPNQTELSLKPSAARLLNMPPDEQDALVEWLVAHQPVAGAKISASKNSDHYAMKYVPYAPGDFVGTYANGDVIRTGMLFTRLWKEIRDRNMLTAYDRERELMPILLSMERQGVPVDVKRLRSDIAYYRQTLIVIGEWICRKLKTTPDAINLDSGDQLMAALIAAKIVDAKKVPRTKTGKYQSNKEALLSVIHDQQLLAILKYRTQLKTCLQTFMEPWLETALRSNGLIYTTWNQVKSPKGDDNIGTRTGRLSSTPNFQNLPKEFNPIFRHETTKSDDRKRLPVCPIAGLRSLPQVRSYIIPGPRRTFVDRDYSQQEPRILAHFDGGALMQKYISDPWIDFHDYAKAELEKVGLFYDRKPVKNTNLGLIYGMGVGKLAMKNSMDVTEASGLKKAILNLYPGLREMYRDMKVRSIEHVPLRTWGGREYYCEEPKIIDGRLQTFDYKMVNSLIQGSAADCTKEAIIRFHRLKMKHKKPDWWLYFNVHDQLTVSVPTVDRIRAMAVLKEAMESVEFDVPMLSEGSMSSTTWEDLKDYDKKGRLVT